MGAVSDVKHYGVPGTWGAQTWAIGDRTALAVDNARRVIAAALSLLPGVVAEAPPTKAAADARARAR